MVEVAAERGLAAPAALLGSGLLPADLRDPDLEVEAGQELAVVRNIVRELRDPPGLGAIIGKRITLGMLGLLGFAMISSRTARDAIEISDRLGYGKLSPLFLRPYVDERSDSVRVVYDDSELPDESRGFLVGRDLALCVQMLPAMFGERLPGVIVSVSLSGTHGEAFARELRDWHVTTAARENSVTIGNELLSRPLPNADEHTILACERYIQELVTRRNRRTGVAARVRSSMLRHRPIVPSLAELAAERHVDPRTLRRQLAAEGTSFRRLADEVREALAVELLDAGLTQDQVADRLGYSDAASFARAFRRWTGHPPGRGRRSALDREA